MNNLAVIEGREQNRQLTAGDVRAQVNLIQEVMKGVMKPNTHYGVIPGCKQPSLYKAGSEVLLTTFRIAVEPEVTDLSTPDEIRYRVRAIGRHQTSGIIVGVGIGECSTGEEKYKWRTAVCDEEWEDTPENMRRVKYGSSYNKATRKKEVYKSRQVRTNPADLANTVLKMAKKRAQIDLTLTATAASDIFTQDIEDMPEELRDFTEDAPRITPGASAAEKASSGATDNTGIIARLEAVAAQGWPALQKAWGDLSQEERQTVGADFGRIKKLAEASNGTA